jgi:hypothetical protein
MATINQNGHVQAHCPTCSGALTSFQIGDPQHGHYGQVFRQLEGGGVETYRLACCSGSGAGALITLLNDGRHTTLEDFYPEAEERQTLPAGVPDGIVNEFREGEECAEAGCYRAAAASWRRVVDVGCRCRVAARARPPRTGRPLLHTRAHRRCRRGRSSCRTTHLAVILLAQLPAVLPRHAHRMLSLLRKTRVINDPVQPV